MWVGKLSARLQREYERHVASIVDSFRSGGSPDPVDIKWVGSLPERIRDKFVSWQMVPAISSRKVSPEQRTVGGWTQLYINEIVSDNPRTKDNYGQARDWLTRSVDAKKDIASITLGDLQRWQRSMKSLALSTRNKHVQRVKTMFEAAVSDGVLECSPAAKLKEERSAKRVDRTKQQFVTADETTRVLESLPNTTWKLMFALMRFQGLRRHEMFALEWSHIDWDRNELTIPPDTKTGHRTMPIFQRFYRFYATLRNG